MLASPKSCICPVHPNNLLLIVKKITVPQPALDRNRDKGMATFVGRLREDTVYDYKFVGLSHNTLRGAAGGAVLNAELLASEGYLVRK